MLKRLLRRLRGALGMSLWWAAVWGVVGGVLSAALSVGTGLGTPEIGITLRPALFLVGVFWAYQGFMAGLVFSAMVTIIERRRTLAQLSRVRLSTWGAIGGALFPTITGLSSVVVAARVPLHLPLGMLIGAIGGGLAAYSSLALARRATAMDSANGPALLSERAPDYDLETVRRTGGGIRGDTISLAKASTNPDSPGAGPGA